MNKITSVQNPNILNLQKLKQKKGRTEQSRILLEGYHLVEEAYKANCLEQVLAVNEQDFKYPNVVNQLVSNQVIKKLASTMNPQPIIGVAKIIEKPWEKVKQYLLLDDIQDPGNMGTMIRTAAALGIDAIVVSEDSVDIYNEKVIRSTQGTLFKLPIFKRPLKKVISELKSEGIPLICTSLKNAKPIQTLNHLDSFALIMGSEAHGVKEEILSNVSMKVFIPMENEVESLNVAIACGIVLYHLTCI